MDDDHRQLLDIINRLYDALATNRNPVPHCNARIEHALVHFAHEEQWCDSMGYPRAARHRLMHEKLTQRLIDYRAQLRGEERLAIDDFARFDDWLAHHITAGDRFYGAWLNSQGIH